MLVVPTPQSRITGILPIRHNLFLLTILASVDNTKWIHLLKLWKAADDLSCFIMQLHAQQHVS
jgi:hypothetical protein